MKAASIKTITWKPKTYGGAISIKKCTILAAMIGVYKITSPTGRVYIGQSTNIENRLRYYKGLDCKRQNKLYNSLKKYGFDKHKFEVIEECKIQKLNKRERYYQDKYNVLEGGLNCILIASGQKRERDSRQTALKKSKSKMGKRNPMFGVKGKNNPLFGRALSKTHRDNLSKNSGQSKGVMCSVTKNKYKSLTEACRLLGLNYGYMMNIMQGHRKNTTTLSYIKK